MCGMKFSRSGESLPGSRTSSAEDVVLRSRPRDEEERARRRRGAAISLVGMEAGAMNAELVQQVRRGQEDGDEKSSFMLTA